MSAQVVPSIANQSSYPAIFVANDNQISVFGSYFVYDQFVNLLFILNNFTRARKLVYNLCL